MTEPPADVTMLLQAARAGDEAAARELWPLVYGELHRIAGRHLGREAQATAGPTALVHEAWLKLGALEKVDWQDRAHFLAVAARAMRQVLVDQARHRGAIKRGGAQAPATLIEAAAEAPVAADELIAIDELLDQLDAVAPRQRQVVEMRFFAGMGEREIAAALGVTERTVGRDWVAARAWLAARLAPEREG